MGRSRMGRLIAMGVIGGGAGVPTLPVTTGLQFWLDASLGTFQDSAKTTAAAADNDRVGAWADQSDNGRDVLQATDAKRATLKLNVLNGRPAVRFADAPGGSEQFLTAASLSLAGYASDFCVIFAGSIVASPAQSGEAFVQWATVDGNNSAFSFFATNTSTVNFRYPNSNIYGTISTASGTYYGGAASVFRGYNDGANAGFNINGAEVNSVPWVSATARTITTIHVGSLDGAYFLAGDIFEMLVYKPCPSAANMIAVEQYLKTKYGMSF